MPSRRPLAQQEPPVAEGEHVDGRCVLPGLHPEVALALEQRWLAQRYREVEERDWQVQLRVLMERFDRDKAAFEARFPCETLDVMINRERAAERGEFEVIPIPHGAKEKASCFEESDFLEKVQLAFSRKGLSIDVNTVARALVSDHLSYL